jgi:hypothetical protein
LAAISSNARGGAGATVEEGETFDLVLDRGRRLPGADDEDQGDGDRNAKARHDEND